MNLSCTFRGPSLFLSWCVLVYTLYTGLHITINLFFFYLISVWLIFHISLCNIIFFIFYFLFTHLLWRSSLLSFLCLHSCFLSCVIVQGTSFLAEAASLYLQAPDVWHEANRLLLEHLQITNWGYCVNLISTVRYVFCSYNFICLWLNMCTFVCVFYNITQHLMLVGLCRCFIMMLSSKNCCLR